MSEQQPELRWAPIPPKPKNRGRIWLIIGLIVAVLAIAGALLFFLLPRDGAPDPDASASPTPTATRTATPTPTATPSPTPTPTPSTPVATEPPVVDPSVDMFRDQVGGRLNDATRGLELAASADGADAVPVIESLRLDAQLLSDAQAPTSISDAWYGSVNAYSASLSTLLGAANSGSGFDAALADSQAALQALRAVVGL